MRAVAVRAVAAAVAAFAARAAVIAARGAVEVGAVPRVPLFARLDGLMEIGQAARSERAAAAVLETVSASGQRS